MIQYFPIVTGSLVVLGNVSISGSLNASGSIALSGSVASASYALSASNAATASSADNFLTRGTLTAQTIVVQTITSSVDFVTGSTRFGSLSSNTHQFTGSVSISGSLASTGSITTVAPTGNANLIIQTLQAGQNTQIQFVNTAKTVYIGNQIASAGSIFEVHDASLGASRLLISSSGDVGIGTITPSYKLEVTSGSIASIGNEHAFYFRRVTGTPSDLYSFSADSATAYLYNHTSASILMTWSELGNVGIGTSLALSKLDVNLLASGARRLLVNYDDSLVTIKSANASSTAESLRVWGDNIYFYTGSAGSELMRLTNTGRVGIGITNPSRKLQVMEAGTATSGDVIGVRNDNSTAGAYINFIAGGGNAPAIGAKGNDITFTTDGYSGTEIMRLTSTSRVGIGTTTPSGSRLHVFIGNDGGSGTPGVILATSNGANDIVRFQDGTTTVAVVKNSGAIGIGTTSPSRKLSIDGGASTQTWTGYQQNGTEKLVVGLDASGNPSFYGTQANDAIFYTNNTERMRITSGGTIQTYNGATLYGEIYIAGTAMAINGYNGDLNLQTSGANRLKINSSGWIGIDRTATANRLEVNGDASKTTAGSWLANSDINIKTDINTIEGALDRINKVRLVSFKYKDAYKEANNGIKDKFYHNVIAQEFQEIYPDYVYDSGDLFEEHKVLQVDTNPMYVDSVSAIQELSKMIQEQQAQIEELKARLA